MQTSLVLVAHYNAFNGVLQGGYLMNRRTNVKLGATMNPQAVLAYMSANPGARVSPLKV